MTPSERTQKKISNERGRANHRHHRRARACLGVVGGGSRAAPAWAHPPARSSRPEASRARRPRPGRAAGPPFDVHQAGRAAGPGVLVVDLQAGRPSCARPGVPGASWRASWSSCATSRPRRARQADAGRAPGRAETWCFRPGVRRAADRPDSRGFRTSSGPRVSAWSNSSRCPAWSSQARGRRRPRKPRQAADSLRATASLCLGFLVPSGRGFSTDGGFLDDEGRNARSSEGGRAGG